MDYIEEFKNLRTNNKWGRKSPHKAVLLLAVIEMFEKNILTDNEIIYDDKLKSMFLKLWNKVLPKESMIHPDAYLPFWYLQSNEFWHVVPKRGQEEILSLMRDVDVKPSEMKLYDSVKYAELDDDLYFMMTIPSGRSSLKRALLETYFDLTEKQIDKLSESEDNTVDYSVSALSDYEKIVTQDIEKTEVGAENVNEEAINQFNMLNEDLKISLNYEYYSYLKNHRNERDLFKEICPTVYDLYHNIVNHPIRKGEIAPSYSFVYENFLSDLKISLMSEEGAMELIERIETAIDILRGNAKDLLVEEQNDNLPSEYPEPIEEKPTHNISSSPEEFEIEDVYVKSDGKIDNIREDVTDVIPEKDFAKEDRKGKPWSENEEELITLYFNQGKDAASIAAIVGRTEVSIKMRLAKLGLIEYVYGQDDPLAVTTSDKIEEKAKQNEFAIQNYLATCSIYNKSGENIFSSEGKLKYINDKLYRLNLKSECFTIKEMQYENDKWWIKGAKKIVAYPQSKLYKIIENANDYCGLIEDIYDSPIFSECKLKAKGVWYDNCGNSIEEEDEQEQNLLERIKNKVSGILHPEFTPKGKFKDIPKVANCIYDYLWTMSLVEFMQFKPQPSFITYDRLACMAIAIAWEIINEEISTNKKEEPMVECINYLIEESKLEMRENLDWNSSRKEVFQAIKNYPMAGVFEDLVDELIEKSPYNVLRAWFPNESDSEIIKHSALFEKSCIYAIHNDRRDPYIEVNNNWKKYLFFEHDNLMNYYKQLYLLYLEES